MAQTEAAQKAALLNYQLSIQNAFADVDNALVANQKLKDQLAAQERLVAALKDYARLAKLQYDGGYTAYSTVLQAEQSLFPAELTLAAVRASVFTSAANTYKAMGGGWVTEADKLTGSAVPAATRRPGHRRCSSVIERPASARLRGDARRGCGMATMRTRTSLPAPRTRAALARPGLPFGNSAAARSRARSAMICPSAELSAAA